MTEITPRARGEWRPKWQRQRDRRMLPSEYRRRSGFVRFPETMWVVNHPVAGELTDGELRSWLVLLASIVAKDCEDGRFVLGDVLPFYSAEGDDRRVTADQLETFERLGLVVPVAGEPGVYRVRDWGGWNPKDATNSERQRRWRARQKWRRSQAELDQAKAERAAKQIAEWMDPPAGTPRTLAESMAADLERRGERDELDASTSHWPTWNGLPAWPDGPGEAS